MTSKVAFDLEPPGFADTFWYIDVWHIFYQISMESIRISEKILQKGQKARCKMAFGEAERRTLRGGYRYQSGLWYREGWSSQEFSILLAEESVEKEEM